MQCFEFNFVARYWFCRYSFFIFVIFSAPEIAFFRDELIQEVMTNVLFCYARLHAKLVYRQVEFVELILLCSFDFV